MLLTTDQSTKLFENILSRIGLPVLDTIVLSQTLWQWILLFLSFGIGIMLRKFASFLFGQIERVTGTTSTQIDNILVDCTKKQVGWLVTLLFWYVVIHEVGYTDGFTKGVIVILKVIFFYQLMTSALALTKNIDVLLKLVLKTLKVELNQTLFPIVSRVVKVLIFSILPLVALQNLGINVMSLVAGLGLGGLAFALAAKDTAANLFGSIMILIDKPFVAGDWVIIGKSEGTATEIGLRSTRIRTFYDSVISIPNSEVANQTIDNMGKRVFRRVKTNIGVTYDSSPEQLEGFLEAIKEIIVAHPHTRKDYYQVVFSGFGNSSLDILLYFFIQVPDWSRELVVKQNIYLDIMRVAKELGIEFAYPTTTIHIDSHNKQKEKVSTKQLDEMKRFVSEIKDNANPEGLGLYKPIYEK